MLEVLKKSGQAVSGEKEKNQKYLSFREECKMKKMLKNKKGFTLVELIIVVAIIGVLALISLSIFNGMVSNTRRAADEKQAQTIQNVLQAYITDTNDITLVKLAGSTATASGAGSSPSTAKDVIELLQTKKLIKYPNGTEKMVGPLLQPDTSVTPAAASYEKLYKPQWNKAAGGEHTGYTINVDKASATVSVVLEKGSSDSDGTCALN